MKLIMIAFFVPCQFLQMTKHFMSRLQHTKRMKIISLINRIAAISTAIGILSFFSVQVTAEDRKDSSRHHQGKGHHDGHHGKPEARPGGSSHGKSSFSSLRERWSKMSEKERNEARGRMREAWEKRMREARERYSRDGNRDHGKSHGKPHGKPDGHPQHHG